MERKFYTDDFEQLLREQSDEFRMYPSKRVWHSIYNDLHPGRKWPSVAVSMFLIVALLMMGYWNSNSNNPVTSSKIDSVTPATTHSTINEVDDNNSAPASAVNLSSTPNTPKNINTISGSSKNILASTIKKAATPAAGKLPVSVKNGGTADSNVATTDEVASERSNTLTREGNIAIMVTTPAAVEEMITAATPGTVQNTDINNIVALPGQNNIVVVKAADDATVARTKATLSAEDKAWIEDYAFHNKSKRKPWKDRTTLDLYLTPNVSYRKLSNDPKHNLPLPASSFAGSASGAYVSDVVDQRPGLGLEAGLGITYAVGKNFRLKAGVQANYTNYGVNADETNHPVLTTLLFIDPVTGYPYLSSSSSTLSNSSGLQPVRRHNKTYQLSIPLGMAVKIMGNEKLEFYAGAALQPTLVLGGKANVISADRKNYVADASLIRHWNLNTGFETYINYKLDGFTLQAGPQFRYQLFSTYDKKYAVTENLYSMGVKVGILKNF
jgi:hypothetical protein